MLFEYSAVNTAIHRLDVRTKTVLLGVISAIALIYFDPALLLATLACCLLLAWVSRTPIGQIVRRVVLPSLPVPLFLLIFASFTYGIPLNPNHELAKVILWDIGRVPLIGHLQLTVAGILTGINFALKMYIMTVISIVLLHTTPLDHFQFLLLRLRFPYAIGFIVTTAFRLLPLITREMEITKQAQAIRGAQIASAKGPKAIITGGISVLIPALVNAWRRSEFMALAMSSRGFGAARKRTFLEEPQMSREDYVLSAALIFSLGVLVYLKLAYRIGNL